MTHSKKVQHLLKNLTQRGVSPYIVAPPPYRLLWRLGWQVRPPLFQSFTVLALGMGLSYGVLSGFVLWILQGEFTWQGVQIPLLLAVVTGAFFGLGVAIYYRWKARRLGLGDWERYPRS